MWKALEHLETLSRTKLASDAFKAAIRNGWTDAGFLPADGGPPPVYNHQNFGTRKRRLKRLRSRFAGEFFSAVDLDVGKCRRPVPVTKHLFSIHMSINNKASE